MYCVMPGFQHYVAILPSRCAVRSVFAIDIAKLAVE